MRDVSGQVAAEYIDEPGSEGMSLEREFVYGFGRLLVDRQPSAGTPTQSTSSSLYSTGSYSLDLTDGAGGTSFDVDIQTESGFRNHVPNIQPDGSGRYQIDESGLSPGESNYLRIKAVSPEESPYSMPVSISYEPSIDGSSENQVRSVSVSRVGESLVVRWSLHQENGKAFQIYFHRADNGLTYVLSATALPSGTTEYTIASQALAAPCGGIFLRQGEMGTGGSLTNPTAPSPEAGLPGPFYGEIDPGAGGCLGGSEPPAPRRLVDRYHFRDHFGSLRIETGEAGWLDLGFDYYPFGLRMESDYAESFDESRRKYTGHERDSETGQDYMMARYKGIQLADFMTPDPLIAGGGSGSIGWNRYAYVRQNPLLLIDPTGTRITLISKSQCHDSSGVPQYCPEGVDPGSLVEVVVVTISYFDIVPGWEPIYSWGEVGGGGPSRLDEYWDYMDRDTWLEDERRGNLRRLDDLDSVPGGGSAGEPPMGLTPWECVATYCFSWLDSDAVRPWNNAVVGLGDGVTLGALWQWREGSGLNRYLDEAGALYITRYIAGMVDIAAVNVLGYVEGHEFRIGGKERRVAPWGNRTGHPTGRYPHYHWKRPGSGGSYRWHRPWDPPSAGQPWWRWF